MCQSQKLNRSGSLPRSHAGVFEKNRLYGLETSSRALSLVHPFLLSEGVTTNSTRTFRASACVLRVFVG